MRHEAGGTRLEAAGPAISERQVEVLVENEDRKHPVMEAFS
jgi:hypothetical protein